MSQNYKNAKKMKSQIHCPVSGCLYYLGSERHFTEKRLLNQHIAKVHAEKRFSCTKCQKSFGMDWFRKYHEKTCGMEWKCDCGIKYTSRESLLTHARRTQHKLPDHVILSDKMKQNKVSPRPVDNPVIVLIQPIIQNVTCIQPAQTNLVSPRPILPKTTKPVMLTLSIPANVVSSAPTQNTISPVILEQPKENLFNKVQSFSPDGSTLPTTNQLFVNANSIQDSMTASSHKEFQKSVSTQTIDNTVYNSAKLRQSQASQCTRHKPKSLKAGIESTYTQTAESTVVKIKKRRSRRKSVAITTEPSMLSDQMVNSQNSFWPGLKDFIPQNPDSLGYRLFKSSISTQTNMMNSNKVLCDSETLTDQELFKYSWDDAMKGKENETCNTDFQMLTDMSTDDPLSVLPVDIENNALSDLNIFSSNSLNDFSEIKTSTKDDDHRPSDPGEKGASPVFSVFGNCVKSDTNIEAPPPPTLSDIHTQTMASAVLDYNLLANMETQTTDDFTFSDLEFSDTETQTPWEDFPNIDDSPLQADQLSIEIQTDFSSFPTGLNLDPYELINSMDMQNMISGCSSKETLGVNTETQTLDKFCFPQFTNSESQTLDMPDFMFDSLNS